MERAFIKRVSEHLAMYSEELERATTVYIGGGTPTVLRNESLAALLASIRRVAPEAKEITLEANPESTTPDGIATALAGGVTRLSVGIQSFQAPVLRALGRHGGRPERFEEIRRNWPGDLSADLIIDAPGADDGDALNSVKGCLDSRVDHLSVYSLALEPGTPLFARVPADHVFDLSDEEDEAILQLLCEANLDRYEVSNFARPGHECRHNQAYWAQQGYFGVGPSAVSTWYFDDRALRVSQPDSVAAYIREEEATTIEYLDRRALITEHVMLRLRTREGLDFETMERRYGHHLGALAPDALSRQLQLGLLAERPHGVVATPRGWRYLDALLRALIGEIAANLDTLQA